MFLRFRVRTGFGVRFRLIGFDGRCLASFATAIQSARVVRDRLGEGGPWHGGHGVRRRAGGLKSVFATLVGGIGGMGGILPIGRVALVPMPPTVPTLFALAGGFEGICRDPPVSWWGLTRQDETRKPRASNLLKPRSQELPSAPLRISGQLHVLMQLAGGNGTVGVPFPPNAEEFCDLLPATVALFGLADPFDRIATAEGEQRITDPAGPLLERASGSPVLRSEATRPQRQIVSAAANSSIRLSLTSSRMSVVNGRASGSSVRGSSPPRRNAEQAPPRPKAIAGEDYEGGGVQGQHLRPPSTERAPAVR